MILTKQTILGVSVTTSSKKKILSYCSSLFLKSLRKSIPFTIVTPNAEQIVLAQKNEKFRQILNNADIVLPDGAGVVWALKRMPNVKCQMPNVERISGIDFMVELCREAAKKNARVLLYGGRERVAGKALVQLQKRYPSLQGVAEEAPYFQMTNDKLQITNKYQIQNNQMNTHSSSFEEVTRYLIQAIRSKNIRIVFIGLGAPKQEYLMDALKKRLIGERVILMAVGGSFDVIAGKIERAPKVVQSFGFEWLWRLSHEPWRWKRQLSLLQFIRLVLLQKIGDNT